MATPTSFGGVMGWPLGHTLSPAIHNAAFKASNINSVYLAFEVHPLQLAPAVAGLRALNCLGLNVTMPHKEAIMAALDELSGDARSVGAVNTIQNLAGRLIGHNTDVDGFREFASADAGADLHGASALVLGAGGAARAVVRALDQLGAAEIVVAARRAPVARQLALLAQDRSGGAVAWADATELAGRSDVVINATPLGMAGENPLPHARFRGGQRVFDLVYDPPITPLMRAARDAGAEAWGGLGMLVQQAAGSFRIWTGQDAPIEVMSAAAVRALNVRHRA